MLQSDGAQHYKAKMALVPQREPSGLCGTVPDLLFVNAVSNDDGGKSSLLTASRLELQGNTSRIDDLIMSTSSATPLPACPGPLWHCRTIYKVSVSHGEAHR